jgi:uncharacterized protein (DUF58 family)
MKRKKRVEISVHRSGKIYIFIAIVLGILAINGGNNFHYLAAAAVLGYMAASGETGKHNLKGASVSLSFPEEIYAETPFRATIEVRNLKRFSSISLLDVNVCGGSAFFPIIQPGEVQSALVEMAISRRGPNAVDGTVISSIYPFGLFTCRLFIPDGAMLTIFPKPIIAPESLRTASVKSEEEMEREPQFSSSPKGLTPDSDMVGVRSYAEGDSMRLIHWKSSAKTGSLKSRLYESSGGGKIIDLDRLLAEGVERGLSCASGEIRETIRTGEPIGMLHCGELRDASAARGDKLAMLAVLANYE